MAIEHHLAENKRYIEITRKLASKAISQGASSGLTDLEIAYLSGFMDGIRAESGDDEETPCSDSYEWTLQPVGVEQ